MSSNLEVRICKLVKMVGSGEGQSFGEIDSHASTDDIVNTIVALDFDGTYIKSNLKPLRDALRVATGTNFPGATTVLVIGPIPGLGAEDAEVAAERALAVKDFLLANGVAARNVAADVASVYMKPTG